MREKKKKSGEVRVIFLSCRWQVSYKPECFINRLRREALPGILNVDESMLRSCVDELASNIGFVAEDVNDGDI